MDRRALSLAGIAFAGAVAAVCLLRWKLWSHGVPAIAAGPVPGAFDGIDLARHEEYRRGRWALTVAAAVVGPIVAIVIASTADRWAPGLARLSGRRRWLGGGLLGVAVAVATALAALPVRAVAYGWGREFGLIVQSPLAWLSDLGKGVLIGAALLGGFGALAAVLIARAPRAWWAGLAVVAVAVTYSASVLAPVVVEPLFQRTSPLQDPDLERRVLQIASRQGVDAGAVAVADASRRTTTANAYVSGIGPSRRIVFYDTLLDGLPRDEVVAVAAHELAHVRHDHVAKGTTWAAALLVPGCLLAFAIVGWRTGWRPPGSGIAGTELVLRRVAVLAASATVIAAAATPLGNWVSRAYEREADWTALVSARDADAQESLVRSLMTRSLATPQAPAVLGWWFGTHPTPEARVAMARYYRAGGR